MKKKTWITYASILLFFIIVQILATKKIINAYIMQIVMFAEINVIMTVSLNLINGFTGQFSLGHAAFMGIGAYVSAMLTTLIIPTTSFPKTMQYVVFILTMLVGGVAAGFVGFLIGIPTLKLKGDYLAIVTLAFGEVLKAAIRLTPFIGGPRGITGIPKRASFAIVSIVMVLAIIIIRNYIFSNFGRASIAIRENEIAAQSMGINTTRYKIMSFVVGSFFAGVAGALYAHRIMFIEPNLFDQTASTNYLIYLYAGGMASISGSIISAFVLTLAPEILRFLGNWRYVIYPLILIIIMLKRQNGLLGGREFPFLIKTREEYLSGSDCSLERNGEGA